jgi:thiamine biosynthesis lipoprotein
MRSPANLATVSRLRPGLGTFIAVEAQAAEAWCLEPALAAAFAAVERIERVMHPLRPGSDLAVLRGLKGRGEAVVDPWTWDCLRLCQQLYELSGGVFDPCLPEASGTLGDLQLPGRCRVRAAAPLHIDLGGIAKGYAVDRAVEALLACGCDAGLVNAGGDLRVFGPRDFPVQCRRTDDDVFAVTLRDTALAVSRAVPGNAPAEHRGYYLRADPGRRAGDGVALVAPTAALADGLTKWLLFERGARVQAALSDLGARLL